MNKSYSSGNGEKKLLRRFFSSRRNALTMEELQKKSLQICRNIESLPEFATFEYVAGFVACGAEPDLSTLFHQKQWFLPRFNWRNGTYELVAVKNENDLVPGKYGIAEPAPQLQAAPEDFVNSEILFLVPALACDRHGVRLGRGGGYYDRLLQHTDSKRIAVIFDCQISSEDLPHEKNDIPMTTIITESGIWRLDEHAAII